LHIWKIYKDFKLRGNLMKRDNFKIVPPSTRREMEHNIALVIENALKQIKSKNKMAISSLNHFTLSHLQNLKYLPNGRIFLSSIDESLRLQGNTLNTLNFMPEPKNVKNGDS